MKIGICCIDMQVHGLSSAAHRWREGFARVGVEANLYGFTPGGTTNSKMRSDFPYEVVPYGKKKFYQGVKKLQENHLLIVMGCPYAEKNVGILEVVEESRVPCISYTPQVVLMKYQLYQAVVNLQHLIGHIFPRRRIYENFLASNLPRRVKNKPCLVTKHPAWSRVELDNYVDKDPRRFITTTRLCRNKGTLTVISMWKKYLEEMENYEATLNMYGYTHGTRNGRSLKAALENEYGELWSQIYGGVFSIQDWPEVYNPASFMIDLTDLMTDAGIQVTGIEALEHDIIPIVSKRWAVGKCMIGIGYTKSPKHVFKAAETAIRMPTEKRLELVWRGREYLKRVHDPKTVIGKFLDFVSHAMK